MKKFNYKTAFKIGVYAGADWKPAPFPGKDPLRMAWLVKSADGAVRTSYFGKPSEKQLRRFLQAASKPVRQSQLILIDRKSAVFHGIQEFQWVADRVRFDTRPTNTVAANFYFPLGGFNPRTLRFFRKRIKGKHWYYSQTKKMLRPHIDVYKADLKNRGLL